MTTTEEVKEEHTEHNFKIGTIGTRSGKLIDIFNVNPEDINLDDILTSLSNICRFSGNCDYFSVLQHTLIMAKCCITPYETVHALLHDTPEFLTNDICSPLKRMPEIAKIIKPIEEGIFKAIAQKFGIDNVEKPGIVEYLDKQLVM